MPECPVLKCLALMPLHSDLTLLATNTWTGVFLVQLMHVFDELFRCHIADINCVIWHIISLNEDGLIPGKESHIKKGGFIGPALSNTTVLSARKKEGAYNLPFSPLQYYQM